MTTNKVDFSLDIGAFCEGVEELMSGFVCCCWGDGSEFEEEGEERTKNFHSRGEFEVEGDFWRGEGGGNKVGEERVENKISSLFVVVFRDVEKISVGVFNFFGNFRDGNSNHFNQIFETLFDGLTGLRRSKEVSFSFDRTSQVFREERFLTKASKCPHN